jgi:hypothetical protein
MAPRPIVEIDYQRKRIPCRACGAEEPIRAEDDPAQKEQLQSFARKHVRCQKADGEATGA